MQQIKFVMSMSLANVVRVKSTCLLSDISFVCVGYQKKYYCWLWHVIWLRMHQPLGRQVQNWGAARCAAIFLFLYGREKGILIPYVFGSLCLHMGVSTRLKGSHIQAIHGSGPKKARAVPRCPWPTQDLVGGILLVITSGHRSCWWRIFGRRGRAALPW